MGENSFFDKILLNIFRTDYRVNITVTGVKLVESEFQGPMRHVRCYTSYPRKDYGFYIPISERFKTEMPIDSTATGEILPSSSIATFSLDGKIAPNNNEEKVFGLENVEYKLKFCLNNQDTFKFPHLEQEGLLEYLIEEEVCRMNKAIGKGMVFEDERMWINFEDVRYPLDKWNHNRLISKLPADLARKVLERAKEEYCSPE